VVLLYFGYALCPDICSTSLAYTTHALSVLSSSELGRVRTLFVGVDPERGTLQKLAL